MSIPSRGKGAYRVRPYEKSCLVGANSMFALIRLRFRNKPLKSICVSPEHSDSVGCAGEDEATTKPCCRRGQACLTISKRGSIYSVRKINVFKYKLSGTCKIHG